MSSSRPSVLGYEEMKLDSDRAELSNRALLESPENFEPIKRKPKTDKDSSALSFNKTDAGDNYSNLKSYYDNKEKIEERKIWPS